MSARGDRAAAAATEQAKAPARFTPADALTVVGFLLVVAGVAFIHWPAALISAGVVLLFGAKRGLDAAPDDRTLEEGKR